MKALIIITILLSISACAVSPYHPPKSGDTATLSVPESNNKYSLLGGFSGQSVGVGMLGEDGCIGAMRQFKPVKAESLDSAGKLVVPANTPIALSASSNFGDNICGVMGATTLEANAEYNFMFTRSMISCSIVLIKVSENGKSEPIKMDRLEDKITKFCIKK